MSDTVPPAVDISRADGLAVDDARQLRDAFASFATGIVVVTTTHGGERIGATVSSFNSISLSPPLVSFSIARSAKALEAWASTGQFAVSVLSQAQSDLSTRFARSLGNKWAGISLRPSTIIDAPLIGGAMMWFECETYARYEGGDHIILLGKVLAATRNASVASEPLVFFGGAYRRLAPAAIADIIPEDAMWLHGW